MGRAKVTCERLCVSPLAWNRDGQGGLEDQAWGLCCQGANAPRPFGNINPTVRGARSSIQFFGPIFDIKRASHPSLSLICLSAGHFVSIGAARPLTAIKRIRAGVAQG